MVFGTRTASILTTTKQKAEFAPNMVRLCLLGRKERYTILYSRMGQRGTDTQAAQEMKDFWNWSFNNNKDMLAYTYFDSSLNSPTGSWELTGDRLRHFKI